MATRRETEMRKAALARHIRDLCQQEDARSGAPLPSHRSLSQAFDLSTYTVFSVVQSLIKEGVLHSEPGVGVFARRASLTEGVFVFLVKDRLCPRTRQVFEGFCGELAARGHVSILLREAEARGWADSPHLSGEVKGVFSFYRAEDKPEGRLLAAPTVGFYSHCDPTWDSVAFDDVEGGVLAAQHMLECGHESMAFIGCHHPDDTGDFAWSQQRWEGFRRAVEAAGCSARHIPNNLGPRSDDRQVGASALDRYLDLADCTAVVAMNSLAASGFLAALKEKGISRTAWPAIAGFQDSDQEPVANLTSIQLPYDALGRAGAQRLLYRSIRQAQEPPAITRVHMRLVPSLTSFIGWARHAPAQAKSMAIFGSGTTESPA